jgi:hypothetical protein
VNFLDRCCPVDVTATVAVVGTAAAAVADCSAALVGAAAVVATAASFFFLEEIGCISPPGN